MTEKRGGNEGKDQPENQTVVDNPDTPKMSSIAPSSKQAKHWAKQYRTEIAASSSSVLSTFVAVSSDLAYEQNLDVFAKAVGSIPWIRSRLACKRTSLRLTSSLKGLD